MTPKKLQRGDIVRVADGSEAHGDIGVVLTVDDGLAMLELADCLWPVRAHEVEPLGPLPRTRRWVVELEHDVWLTLWPGDPGRSCVLSNARVFFSEAQANRELCRARNFSSPLFPHAAVRELPCSTI